MLFDRIMRTIGSSSLLLIVGIYFLTLGVAQAQCNFFTGWTDNKDGTVTDTRNGLIWKRCAEGFVFGKGVCTGKGKKADWESAKLMAQQSRFLGKSDWRLPTKEEFESVMGTLGDCIDNHEGEYAASKAIAISGGWFWSSSPYAGDPANAWGIDFRDGGVSNDLRSSRENVRLVRAGQMLDGKATLEFENEITEKAGSYSAERAEASNKLKAMSKDEVCATYGTALREGNIEGVDSFPDVVKVVKKELVRRKLKLVDSLVLKEHINIGISECQLFASWGLPSNQNRSVGSWGVHTQHIYYSGTYVYTENGRVTSWQD